jgi:hypothetical protein
MSQPAVAARAPLPFELVLDDGEPLEAAAHRGSSIASPAGSRRLYRELITRP